MTCTVNPKAGREFENKFIAPLRQNTRGAHRWSGPGRNAGSYNGLGKGASVILCEKSPFLGGALKLSRRPFRSQKDVKKPKKKKGLSNISSTMDPISGTLVI